MPCHKNNGLALVFVIFVLLILGGLFSSQTAVNYIRILRKERDDRISLAKNNAIFAMQMSLGRLQELAGPDDVVTANSYSVAGGSQCNRLLTGVWSNSEAIPVFREWLVSSKYAKDFYYAFHDRGCEKFFPFPGDSDVSCELIEINVSGKLRGRYGYWMSDESQKANIALYDQYAYSNDVVAKIVQSLCPQKFGLANIFGKNSSLENCNAISKVDFPEQLAYISHDAFENFFKNRKSLTVHSYGVLSDPKRGGLKRDLTALSHDQENIESGIERLFENPTSLPCYIPTLQALTSFVNTNNCSRDGRSIDVSATYPLFRPQFNLDYGSYSNSMRCKELGYTTTLGVYPVLAQAVVNIGLAVVDGKLAVAFIPSVVVWNPYTVDLNTNDYIIELCVPNIVNYDPHVTVIGNSDAGQSVLGTFRLKSSVGDNVSTILKLRFTTALKSGEIKIFSTATTQPVDTLHGNDLGNMTVGGDFFYIDTGIDAHGFDSFTVLCTDECGSVNKCWGCFYWRMSNAGNGSILQEIAELDPIKNCVLKQTVAAGSEYSNCFSFTSRMRYGIIDDADDIAGVRWLANSNPRAPYVNRSFCQGYASPFLSHDFISGNWAWKSDIFLSEKQRHIDSKQADYLSGLVLFDVPEKLAGVMNVGYLRHANILPFGYFPSCVIGNSRANPLLPVNKLFNKNKQLPSYWPSQVNVESLIDYSYFLNDVVFDRFFFSTKSGNDGRYHFINRRFKLLNGSSDYQYDENAAKYLLIHGPLNVNTSNIAAWTCSLSAVQNDMLEYIFPRFFTKTSENLWNSLPMAAVEKLASTITKNIKRKHVPFSSIGDFVNRDVSDNVSDCTRAGILQQSIDESKINHEKTYTRSIKNISLYDDASASGFLENGLPDVIEQADILQATSHFLSVRGDTFLVRAYGDSFDGTGAKIERACCEAVIQRVPEFIEDSVNCLEDNCDNLSYVNKKFGRRFKVILFRWVNIDDTN